MNKRFISAALCILVVLLLISEATRAFAQGVDLLWPVQNHSVAGSFGGGHFGIDILNSQQASDANIYAAEDGEIDFAGWDSTGGGNLIKINHRRPATRQLFACCWLDRYGLHQPL